MDTDAPDTGSRTWRRYGVIQRWALVTLLSLTSTCQFFDRNVIAVLMEPIRKEFHASDLLLGLLTGPCFGVIYATAGIPIAFWADRIDRRKIVSISLSIWSVMTALSGMAASFWQLALARAGVGAGEAGALPAGQSLIADYCPPERRSTAISVFMGGIFLGNFLGLSLGGYLALTLGWRATLKLAGIGGLVLSLLVGLGLSEPRSSGRMPKAGSGESVAEMSRVLLKKRSYLLSLAGAILYSFSSYGLWNFLPSYLLRSLNVSLSQVSGAYGPIAAVASCIGALGVGRLSDKLSNRNIRWLAWLTAASYLTASCSFVAALCVGEFRQFLCCAFVAHLTWSAGAPPMYTGIHAICGDKRRAAAVGFIYFLSSLLGAGIGPLATGAISDMLAPHLGVDSLRASMIAMALLLGVSGAVFWSGGASMEREAEA